MAMLVAPSALAGAGIFQTFVFVMPGNTFGTYEGSGGAPTLPFTEAVFPDESPLSTFLLKGGEVNTFQDNNSNVTSAQLYYSIFPEG